MARSTLAAFFLVVLPLVGKTVSGLYADQAGTWDWHKQFIGKVTQASFTGGKLKRAFVATEENVVAALNLKSGDIAWRQVLAEDDAIDSLRLAGRYVLTLSKEGQHVRAWGPMDGMMLWEHNVYTPAVLPVPGGADIISLDTDLDGDEVDDLCVLGRGQIQIRSGEDGLLLHTLNMTAMLDDTPFEGGGFRSLVLDKSTVYAVGLMPERDGYLFTDVKADAITIKSTGEMQIAGAKERLSENFITFTSDAGSPAVVGLTADGTSFTVAASSGGSFPALATLVPVSSVFPGTDSVSELRWIAASSFAVSSGGVQLTLALERGALKALLPQTGVVSAGISLAAKEGIAEQKVFGTIEKGAAGQPVAKVYDAAAPGTPLLEEAVPALRLEEKGGPTALFVNSFARKNGTHGFRMLVVCQDASAALVQQGEVVWERDEALASVQSVAWLDPPPSKDGLEMAVPVTQAGLQQSLYNQWLQLKVRMRFATPEETAELVAIRRANGDKLLMEWDPQGFRKVMVLATRCGAVVALHNGDGRVVWRAHPGGQRGKAMLLARLPPDDRQHPEVLLVSEPSPAGTTTLTRLDGWTGLALASSTLPFKVAHVLQLPHVDSEGRRVVVVVDEQHKAHLVTDGPEALDEARDSMDAVFFYTVDYSRNQITGYGVTMQVAGKGPGTYATWDSVELWQVSFPDDITAVSARRPEEHIYSQARILGDRSALYKYLNPNTIFVATSPRVAGTGAESSMTAHLIDTITGRMLYRVRHAAAQAPVQAVFSENWVVYQYWNVAAHRNEMSVLEVYDDDAAQSESGILQAAVMSALGLQDSKGAGLSSLHAPLVRVLGQSYFFSMGLRCMAVTSTMAGVTSKNILLGTQTDQVLAMEKRFLDPRRPTKPSATDKEEGLVPYNPLLPIIPQHFVTTNHQVARLEGISTHPARLESTSLAFAHGLDLYYTRIMPSKMYDTLDENEFSYALLVLTIVALCTATAVVGTLVHNKELDRKWQ